MSLVVLQKKQRMVHDSTLKADIEQDEPQDAEVIEKAVIPTSSCIRSLCILLFIATP